MNGKEITTIVKDFTTHGEHFVIVRRNSDNILMAINYNEFDENGYLKRVLNGLEMFVDVINNDLQHMIERIERYYEWKRFIADNNIDTDNPDDLKHAICQFYKIGGGSQC